MYKLGRGSYIIRISDGARIPAASDNADYQDYLRWVAAGNTAAPADPNPLPTKDQLDLAELKNYAKLNALKTMSPSEIVTWANANVTTLAQARDAITTLAVAVSILARRL